ncbi:hypothetical protein NL676_012423 [Syzygium grande]|nr:hypothetical protein NL676_012423 [Syzygium grande]
MIESNGLGSSGANPVANLDVLQEPSAAHLKKSPGIARCCVFWRGAAGDVSDGGTWWRSFSEELMRCEARNDKSCIAKCSGCSWAGGGDDGERFGTQPSGGRQATGGGRNQQAGGGRKRRRSELGTHLVLGGRRWRWRSGSAGGQRRRRRSGPMGGDEQAEVGTSGRERFFEKTETDVGLLT